MNQRYAPRTYDVSILGNTVHALVEVSGRWLRETRESPAEGPDCDIKKAWRSVTDEETGAVTDVPVLPALLSDDEQQALIFQAEEKDQERESERDEQ
jgi:hypothetical protein